MPDKNRQHTITEGDNVSKTPVQDECFKAITHAAAEARNTAEQSRLFYLIGVIRQSVERAQKEMWTKNTANKSE